jgi:hypothetical protein
MSIYSARFGRLPLHLTDSVGDLLAMLVRMKQEDVPWSLAADPLVPTMASPSQMDSATVRSDVVRW